MFEVAVESIFSIIGRGTVFAGRIQSGSISVGDPVVVKTPSAEIPTRVIGLEEFGTGRHVENAEAGSDVGVLCQYIDHKNFRDVFVGEGDNAKVVGVTLTLGEKKKWWQF